MINASNLEFRDKDLVLPVTEIEYPDGFDELVGRVWLKDNSHVSMPVLEAAGSTYTETVRDAESLTFRVPRGYWLHKQKELTFSFYFRKHNVQGRKSPVMSEERTVPGKQSTENSMSLMSGITEANGYRPEFVKFMEIHLKEPRPDPHSYIYEWARGHECNRRGMRGCSCQQRFLQSLDAPGYWKKSITHDYTRIMGTTPKTEYLEESTYGGSPAPARAPAQRAGEPQGEHAELIHQVQIYARERHHGENHVKRWNAVLTALGYKTSEPAMSYDEAMVNYKRFSKRRWAPVLVALKGMGTAPEPAVVEPKPEPPKTTPRTHELIAEIDEELSMVSAQDIGRAVSRSGFAALQTRCFDEHYAALPMETWMKVLKWSDIDRIKYVASKRDCDNFAVGLAGQVSMRLGVNAVGIAMDFSGRHAYCVLIVKDTQQGGCYVRLAEPQSDGLPQVGDIMSGHEAYKATRGEILFL